MVDPVLWVDCEDAWVEDEVEVSLAPVVVLPPELDPVRPVPPPPLPPPGIRLYKSENRCSVSL